MIKRIALVGLLTMAALGGDSNGIQAQLTPAERARDIISGFGVRSSLPPIETQAKLNAADADVCLELGNQLAALSPDEAGRLCGHIGRSDNGLAHASLLIGMAGSDEVVRGICVDTLVTLTFDEVFKLGPASRRLLPSIFERLRNDGQWAKAIEAKVRELCSQDQRGRSSLVVIHQQINLALVLDLYGGENGFETLVNELLKLLVGEGPADDEPEEKPAVDPAAGPDKAVAPPSDGLTDQERERRRLMQERRLGAIEMFRRILIIDPDGFFQLGRSATYDRRVERAGQFWDRLGGVELPDGTAEQRKVESSRLIRNDYIRQYGPVRTWRGMIQWAQRESMTRDEKVMALILMDELCGGIEVDGEKPEVKPDEEVNPNEPPPKVPAIVGATLATKIEEFLKLDQRTGQRPRVRAIRSAFVEKFQERR